MLPIIPYIFATYEYDKLIAIKPIERAELENNLFLYSTEKIDIEDCLWKDYIEVEEELKKGLYCQEYLILGQLPIDVIYDSKHQVLTIVPSFK
jgi:hypothetical protein